MRLSTLTLSLSLISSQIMAAQDMMPSKQMMINMITQSQNAQCNSQAFLSCMQISKSTCDKINKKFVKSCLSPLPDSTPLNESHMQSLETCGNKLASNLGLDVNKMDACSNSVEDEPNSDPNFNWQADADPKMVQEMLKDGLSQEQIKSIITENHNMRESLKGMGEQLKTATATGTRIDEITLPLYSPHVVNVHYADGFVMDGVKSLPVIMMTTKASKKQVMDFYRKNLTGFKQDVEYPNIFAEKLVPGTSIYKYAQIPNVQITNLNDGTITIQVGYRPQ